MAPYPAVILVRVTGEASELSALQVAFDDCPEYFMRVRGQRANPDEMLAAFTDIPDRALPDAKYLFAIRAGDTTVGCIDVIRGFPGTHHALLGLLLVRESVQGRGIGSAAYRALETVIAGWPECRCVRIGVVRTNVGVLGFWHRMGFVETGEIRPYLDGLITSEVIVLENELPTRRMSNNDSSGGALVDARGLPPCMNVGVRPCWESA